MRTKRPWGNQQLVILMFGWPGSGKSDFACRLAKKYDLQWLNADAVRHELFGHRWLGLSKLPKNKIIAERVINKRTADLLGAGYSLVRDQQHGWRSKRDFIHALAKKSGATALIVWIQTPVESAIERGMSRPQLPHSVRGSQEHMQMIIKRAQNKLQPPAEDERYLKIDGLAMPERQLEIFEAFAASLRNDLRMIKKA